MAPAHDALREQPDRVPVSAVLAPRFLLGAALLGGGAAALVFTSGLLHPRPGVLVAWPAGLAALGVLQVLFGDRLLSKLVGLCLACLGAAGALFAVVGPRNVEVDPPLHAVFAVVATLLGGWILVRAHGSEPATPRGPGWVRVFSMWSGQERRVDGLRFEGGDATAIMGGFELDLRGARLEPGETAVLDVLAVMGGGKVLVPAEWAVETSVVPLMGGVGTTGEARVASTDGPPPCLRLEGLALMGGFEVERA